VNKQDDGTVLADQHRRGNRVSVVGGSIGGLTAALLLRDAGWEVDVFERSAVLLAGRGGGIVLHPSTARYLIERAGVTLAEIGVSARWLRYVDRSGGVAHQERCRYRFTSYDSLYRPLLESFGRDRYHLAEECIGLDDPHGSPCLEFASGRVARADLVVFADGINSFGRRLLAPRAEPHYAGALPGVALSAKTRLHLTPSMRSRTRSPTTSFPRGTSSAIPSRGPKARTVPVASRTGCGTGM